MSKRFTYTDEDFKLMLGAVAEVGTKGSGHHGHKGIPGHRGGSVSSKTTWYQIEYPTISRILGDSLHVDGDGDVQRRHLEDMDKLPTAILQAMKDRGVQTYIGDKSMTRLDNNQRLRGVIPRGWPSKYTWDDVAGAYDRSTLTLSLGKGLEGSNSLALHEIGHFVNYLGDKSGGSWAFSNNEKFRDIYRRIPRDLSPYFKQTGFAGPSEVFAEAFSGYFIGGRGRTSFEFGGEVADFVEEVLDELNASY